MTEVLDLRTRVLVIGAGIAGLATALSLAPHPVTIIARAQPPAHTATAWAQGGIAAATGPNDSTAQHAADTCAAGAGLTDPEVATRICAEGPAAIAQLATWGVPFTRTANGDWARGLEAAHGHHRIHHTTGDGAGAAILGALMTAARKAEHINWLTDVQVTDLIRDDETVAGVTVIDETTRSTAVFGAGVVLATGGLGGLYAATTNPLSAQGQGLGLALRARAAIRDPAFVQFHPTAIAIDRDPLPLASEAVRGDGAALIRADGSRLMADIPGGDLAPRDVVARAIADSIGAGQPVYLDAREALGARFPQRFPGITAVCRAVGIDPVTQPIPVCPAAHYHMGGIAVDGHGRSTVPGLWACGEVASTGLHGANRLASNSLLEAVVGAAAIAADIHGQSLRRPTLRPQAVSHPAPHEAFPETLRQAMRQNAGVNRDAAGLAAMWQALTNHPQQNRAIAAWPDTHLAAALITLDAWCRPASCGAHQRRDGMDAPANREIPAHSIWTLADLDVFDMKPCRDASPYAPPPHAISA